MTLLIPSTSQLLVIEKVEVKQILHDLKVHIVEIVSESDTILHIVHSKEISDKKDKIELIIKSIAPNRISNTNKILCFNQIDYVRNQIKTLIPHKPMDDNDRQEQHLTTTDTNNHNIIQNFSKQIKANDEFNKTFTILKNAIESHRLIVLNKINSISKIEDNILSKSMILKQIIKLNIIKCYLETIQTNIASAKTGIIQPTLLSSEEIEKYTIDFNKLPNIKLGVAFFLLSKFQSKSKNLKRNSYCYMQ